MLELLYGENSATALEVPEILKRPFCFERFRYFCAVICNLSGGSSAAAGEVGLAIHFLNEAYRHGKPIAAISDGSLLMDACALGGVKAQDEVIVGEGANAIDRLIAALLQLDFRDGSSQVPACPPPCSTFTLADMLA